MESAGELGIADRVIFAGHRDDPASFLDAMDLFVLPVPAGSMSIALLEAMARGLAPLITFCGPEEAVVAGESGYCAPPRDPDGLARSLTAALLDAAALRNMGERAACHVRRHFSVARVADDTLEVYTAERGAIPMRLRLPATSRSEGLLDGSG
jgi:glycosyltransferase involved in cell wall biosynthesis